MSPPSGLARRAARFVGRAEELERLHRALEASGKAGIASGPQSQPNAVLSGMGGIGKTELAVHYALTYADEYERVFFLDADTRENLARNILDTIAPALEVPLPDPRDVPEAARRAHAVLAHPAVADRRLLLIYDNVTDVRHLDGLLPGPPVRAIVTTRVRARPAGWHWLELDVLEQDEGLDLLRGILGDECVAAQREAAAELCGLLDGLPLAIELCGGWLNALEARKRNVAGLVADLKARGVSHEALDSTERDQLRGQRGLEESLGLSWRALGEAPHGQTMLRLAALFAPRDIPERLLLEAATRPEAGLPAEGAEAALAECVRLSLLKKTEQPQAHGGEAAPAGRYQMHRLVREFVAAQGEGRKDRGRLEEAFVRTFVRFAQEEVDVARLREAAPDIPHLQEAVGLAPSCIRDEDVTWPHNGLGRYYAYSGAFREAKWWYAAACELAQRRFGSEHPEYATCVNNLAGMLRAEGDLKGARERFERALEIAEKAFGPEDPRVATMLNNLAGVLHDLGDLQGARERYERALEIDRAAYGEHHPEIGTDLNNVAAVLKDLGDLDGARERYERALEIGLKTLPAEHPTIALRLNNLAVVLKDVGELDGARERFERALEIDRAAYGEDHPAVGTDLNNLALVLKDLGELDGARERFERALEIDRVAYGEDHPEVGTDLNNLAGVLRDLGDLDGARERYERALDILEARLPPEHPHIRIVRNHLAALLKQMGQAGPGMREQ